MGARVPGGAFARGRRPAARPPGAQRGEQRVPTQGKRRLGAQR